MSKRREQSKNDLKKSINETLDTTFTTDGSEIQATISNVISIELVYLFGDLIDELEALRSEISDMKLAVFEIEKGVCQNT